MYINIFTYIIIDYYSNSYSLAFPDDLLEKSHGIVVLPLGLESCRAQHLLVIQFTAKDLTQRGERALHPLTIHIEHAPQFVPFDGLLLVGALVVRQATVPEYRIVAHKLDESALFDVVPREGHDQDYLSH